MRMPHTLPTRDFAINAEIKTIWCVCLHEDFAHLAGEQKAGGVNLGRGVKNRSYMLAGHNQRVPFGHGIDVVEGARQCILSQQRSIRRAEDAARAADGPLNLNVYCHSLVLDGVNMTLLDLRLNLIEKVGAPLI